MPYPLRIFLSYSHEDGQLASSAADVLFGLGYVPMWDKNIRPGIAFTEEIKRLIHYSHVFMPLITRNSSRRPWVHQETGYATALNIPILPIAFGSIPGEMVAQLQAVTVNADFSDFRDRISSIDLEQMVLSPRQPQVNAVEISDWSERRAELLAHNCRIVSEIGQSGRVRQRASLSSFSIPDKDVSNAIWDQRDGDVPRSTFYHNLLREERRGLELHARKSGCDLIVDPDFCLERNGMPATLARLQILKEFLQSMPDDKVRVAISPKARSGNLTILGDWFSAESVSPRPGEGHRQTIFTWHPPTVLRVMQKFDEDFAETILENHIDPATSRQQAIAKIDQVLAR